MDKHTIIDKLKEMVKAIEADTGEHEWLFGGMDKFIAEVKEVVEFARLEIIKAHAPKIQWHSPEGWVAEVAHVVSEVKEAVQEAVAEVKEEVAEVIEEVKEAVTKKKAAKAADNNKE